MRKLSLINPNLKDWEIAKSMFGKNTKKECKLVANLRKHYTIEPICNDTSIIFDTTLQDDCGWIINNENLT